MPLAAASLLASLAFNGVHLWAFALSLALLLGALAWSVAGPGAWPRPPVRLTPLAATLGAWWAWLALGVLWSPVLYVSAIEAWWKGALPLAYFALALAPRPAHAWRWSVFGLLAVATALAFWGIWEGTILGVKPQSAFLNPNSHAAFLNLGALMAAGLWLRRRAASVEQIRAAAFAAVFLIASFAMALVGSRGALLAYLGGIAMIAWTAHRHGRSRDAAVLLACAAAALALAHLLRGGVVGARLATLANPAAAGGDRFLIWDATLAMLRDAPWWGTGPGTFWLLYPAYRHPEDSSGGFFAHNDYLQILLEAGWPGLVLTLLVIGAAAWTWRRILLGPHPVPAKLEASGLAAAFAATAVHSLVTFNFYILPILIACGLILARLDQLGAETRTSAPMPRWRPARLRVRPGVWRFVVWAAWLIPVSHLAALALAQREADEGRRLAATGAVADAELRLRRAARLAPGMDGPRLYLARLYARTLERSDALELASRERLSLMRAAERSLDEAQKLNPLRPDTRYLRGRLLEAAPDLAGPDSPARAEAEYRAALGLDPMFVKARVALVNLLVRAGRRKEAAAAVRAGLGRWYPPEPRYIAFLRFAATALDDLGDPEGAARARAAAERLARERAALVRDLRRRGRLPTPGDRQPAPTAYPSASSDRRPAASSVHERDASSNRVPVSGA